MPQSLSSEMEGLKDQLSPFGIVQFAAESCVQASMASALSRQMNI